LLQVLFKLQLSGACHVIQTWEPDNRPDISDNLCLIKYTSVPQYYNSTLSKEYAVNLALGNGDPKDMTTIQDTFPLPTNVIDRSTFFPRKI